MSLDGVDVVVEMERGGQAVPRKFAVGYEIDPAISEVESAGSRACACEMSTMTVPRIYSTEARFCWG